VLAASAGASVLAALGACHQGPPAHAAPPALAVHRGRLHAADAPQLSPGAGSGWPGGITARAGPPLPVAGPASATARHEGPVIPGLASASAKRRVSLPLAPARLNHTECGARRRLAVVVKVNRPLQWQVAIQRGRARAFPAKCYSHSRNTSSLPPGIMRID
jgi:hypothetical protein